MSVPTSYLTSLKNLKTILQSIQRAQAPKRFSTRFLATLGYSSASDRLIIGVLKSLGFLNAEGQPTKRYFEYLDGTRARHVLAEGIREAYADLFQINRNAHEMSGTDIKQKLKTLTQGQVSDSVLDKMASTFKSLAQQADFSGSSSPAPTSIEVTAERELGIDAESKREPIGLSMGGLVYNIQLVLPADRDQAVYDALFRSLKEHLLR